MSISWLQKQSRWVSLSIFLTVAFPFPSLAREACLQLFQGNDEVAAAQPYLSSRFGQLSKPLATPLFQAPARLVLTKFAAHKDFQSSSSFSWMFNGKTYSPLGARESHQIGFRDDESIFADQQNFSLGKMVETNYLKPDEANLFRADGLKRETGQVSFLEVVHDATRDEIQKIYGQYPQTRVGGNHTHRADHDIETQPVKTAALYTVGGQVWNKTGKARKLALPWENEPARQGQGLDREGKHKFVWEWGRAAQDTPGEIAPLYAASALLNYIELRAHGGSLDDAYVMVHSFDKVNTRLYSRMHPGTIYPADWKDPNDALFLIPLREALAKYPARAVSERVAKIIELSDGKISDLDAVDLMVNSKLWHWNELDYVFHGAVQATPIILNDMSNGRSGLVLMALQRLGLERPARERVADYLLQQNHVLHTANHDGKYQNAADSIVTSYQYHQVNGIEISNLDPQLAKRDPNYAAAVVMSAFNYYQYQIAITIAVTHKMTLEEAYPHATQWIFANPIQFGVTTSDSEIERQLTKMNPVHVSEQQGTQADHEIDPVLKKSKPYQYRDARIYFFTTEELRLMILHNPDFYLQHGQGLHEGVWRSHYLMSQTDLL